MCGRIVGWSNYRVGTWFSRSSLVQGVRARKETLKQSSTKEARRSSDRTMLLPMALALQL